MASREACMFLSFGLDYILPYPSIKSEYVVVKYSDNTEETVENALKNNKITISDLDRFEIKHFKEKK